MDDLISRIMAYEDERGEHRSGTVPVAVLRKIAEFAPFEHTMETGCGKTSILLSRISRRHTVYAVDDRQYDGGSVAFVQASPHFNRRRARFVFGPTQMTLPRRPPRAPIDLILLDGPHGYPFPELEYYFTYRALRPGAILVVDDIHIPTVGRFYDFLREDTMFEPVDIVQTTAFLRRTNAPAFPPDTDGWELQAFNKVRFDGRYHPDPRAPGV